MYFSLITPAEGQEHAAIHERMDGPYADHQWLWRWFPTETGAPRDFLFRRHEAQDLPRFYVVSQRRPQERPGAWQARTSDYAPQLARGDELQFELRANPTVRHGRDGKSKRHDVVMEAKKQLLKQRGLSRWSEWTDDSKPELQDLIHSSCSHWLARRGEALGFEIDKTTLVVESCNQHQERPANGSKLDGPLMFTSVDFSGRLNVTDPQALQQALVGGVGRARAFGCGLMLIRRER